MPFVDYLELSATVLVCNRCGGKTVCRRGVCHWCLSGEPRPLVRDHGKRPDLEQPGDAAVWEYHLQRLTAQHAAAEPLTDEDRRIRELATAPRGGVRHIDVPCHICSRPIPVRADLARRRAVNGWRSTCGRACFSQLLLALHRERREASA